MSLVTGTTRAGEAAAADLSLADYGKPTIFGVLAICVFYVGIRIYEQAFGQLYGLDSFAPEFTTYWMTILYIEEPVEWLARAGGKSRALKRTKVPASRGGARRIETLTL